MKRRLAAVAATVAMATALTGCGLSKGLYNVPLPGGANVGSHPMTITAVFTDVLDLVPQASVRVNGIAVGRVTTIKLEPNGKLADVECLVNGNTKLPANAVAQVQQTSLLGEKYIALAAPAAPSSAMLANGARITSTSAGVEAEQVLGALALLLSGGGIAQMHDITAELVKFAQGNEGDIRGFLTNAQTVVGQLDAHKASINAALDALGTLSSTLKANNTAIANILTTLSPGIAELAQQRTQLVQMLTALGNLGTTTTDIINQSKQQTVGDLQSLTTILNQLAAAGSAFPQSLQALVTFPFTDAAISTAVRGDYVNGWVKLALTNPPISATTVSVQQWIAHGNAAASGTPAPPLTPTTAVNAPPTMLPSTSSIASGVNASSVTSSGSAPAPTSSTPSGTPVPSASGSGG